MHIWVVSFENYIVLVLNFFLAAIEASAFLYEEQGQSSIISFKYTSNSRGFCHQNAHGSSLRWKSNLAYYVSICTFENYFLAPNFFLAAISHFCLKSEVNQSSYHSNTHQTLEVSAIKIHTVVIKPCLLCINLHF